MWEISSTKIRDMQTGENHKTLEDKKNSFPFSHFISPSAVRSYDLLTGDIMETTAIFIGW